MAAHAVARRWLCLSLVALSLAACGKKGSLRLPDERDEPPQNAEAPAPVEDPDRIEGGTE